MVRNCKVDYVKKTIFITKKFSKLASVVNSREYHVLQRLKRDNPKYDVEVLQPKEPVTKHSGFSIDFMRTFIRGQGHNEKLEEFEKELATYGEYSGRYGKIKSWFLKQYPQFTAQAIREAADKKKAVSASIDNKDVTQEQQDKPPKIKKPSEDESKPPQTASGADKDTKK
ncbi:MAG: hypothetical protein FWE05_13070 [Defluviitaleaceae bacterium]|nr:hypothetical protein [Defluviitaleaceae bacterium]